MLPLGFVLIGEMVGVDSTPWASDSNKFNHNLGVKVGVRKDNYQVEHTDVKTVSINGDDLQRVKEIVEKCRGKTVAIQVVPNAKAGGRTGAWLSVFMPKGAEITPFK